MLVKWLIGTDGEIKKESVIWNTIGGAVNAGQSAIILIFVSHRLGVNVAGMVTIAYAIAQVFLAIAKYGVRNYQVTDVAEKFSFWDYMYARAVVVAIVFFALLCYLFFSFQWGGNAFEKITIIFEVVVLKLIDAFEDVYLGRFQQVGRLDIGAKIMAFRLVISTGLICLCILLGVGIFASLLSGIISSIFIDIYCIYKCLVEAKLKNRLFSVRAVCHLLKNCFPLCVGTTLAIYIGNVPKYMINDYMNEEAQAIFGYIMMPVFVIMLLNTFIYQPMVKELGELWSRKKISDFRSKVLKQCMIVIGLTVAVLLLGLTLGVPILSFLYNTDLRLYRAEFAVLLVGGGFYALASYLNVPITTMRKQGSIAVGYGVVTVLSIFFGGEFVLRGGIMGASVLYLIITILLVIVYFLILLRGINKKLLEEDI